MKCLPKQYFDGFGNVILAYTQEEVNGLTRQLKEIVDLLQKQNERLNEEKRVLSVEKARVLEQAKRKPKKNAEAKVQPAKPDE